MIFFYHFKVTCIKWFHLGNNLWCCLSVKFETQKLGKNRENISTVNWKKNITIYLFIYFQFNSNNFTGLFRIEKMMRSMSFLSWLLISREALLCTAKKQTEDSKVRENKTMRRNVQTRTQLGETYRQWLLFLFCFTFCSLFL